MASPAASGRPQSSMAGAGVEHALVSLTGVSVLGVLFLSDTHTVAPGASGAVVTFMLMATPVAMMLALALARHGDTFLASVFAIATAALGALVAAMLEPGLAAEASTYLMLAAILVVGSYVMPFPYAAGLGAFNLLAAIVLPSFAPSAGSTALQIPYVFLFSNAMLLLFSSVLRSTDHVRLHRAEEEAATFAARYEVLRAAARYMEAEHDDRVRRLEQKNSSQRLLLDAASHELRTPITPLLLQVAAFQQRYAKTLDDEQQKSLELLERNLRRMGLLVSDLLDIARLEGGQLVLHKAAVPLARLAAQARDTFMHQAAEAGVEIVVDVPDGMTVQADATRLTQVIYNLVSNAVKFSPDAGQVSVVARAVAGGVQVEVTDQGLGFAEGSQDKLFQPFGRVHDDVKGTGLGLYICRGIVTRHGGQIWARSDGVGKGATFGFWLPDPSSRPSLGIAASAPAPDLKNTAAV